MVTDPRAGCTVRNKLQKEQKSPFLGREALASGKTRLNIIQLNIEGWAPAKQDVLEKSLLIFAFITWNMGYYF